MHTNILSIYLSNILFIWVISYIHIVRKLPLHPKPNILKCFLNIALEAIKLIGLSLVYTRILSLGIYLIST